MAVVVTGVNITCEGCSCNISYYDKDVKWQTAKCSDGSSTTVYADNAYSVTLSLIFPASGYTTPITFYYNTSNGSGYDGHETLSDTSRTISDLSFGRTLKLVATRSSSTITAHLKCGKGISSYNVYNYDGSVNAKITGTDYISLTLTEGAYYRLGNIVYKNGWSGIKWYYNSSSSYSYPNKNTTEPNYLLNSTYDRWGYFEATNLTSYTCTARIGTGVSSATVNGLSSATIGKGGTALFRCSLKANYAWDGWYYSDTLLRYSNTRDLNVTNLSVDLDLTAKATYVQPTTYYTCKAVAYSGCSGMFSSITVNGGSSVSVLEGNKAEWRYLIKDGYEFLGWYNSDGAYISGSNPYTISAVSRNTTLYARALAVTTSYWQGADVVSGSSSGVDSVYVNDTRGGAYVDYGGTAVWKCILNPGYKFDGWYDSNGTKISSLNPYTRSNVTSALTLYADVNKAPSYSAYAYSTGFGCCFSSVKVDKSTFAYGDTVTFTANLNPGYTFRGWYNSSGTRVSTNRSYSVTGTDNITLYARANFAWTYDKSSGSSIISAEEFRRLQTYITQRNGASFSSQPNVGDAMTRDYYNMLKNAIRAGSTVIRFLAISAALLNALRDNANNL